jgi:hypothetical protein
MTRNSTHTFELEGDLRRNESTINMLVKYKDSMVDIIKITLSMLDNNGSNVAQVREYLNKAVQQSLDYESQLAKIASFEE